MPLIVQLVVDCYKSPCTCAACLAGEQALRAGKSHVIVFESQISHNLVHMAAAAGLYRPIWQPNYFRLETAGQLVLPLSKGLQVLRADSSRFKSYDLLGGAFSEDYSNLERFVCQYLQACERTPQAVIELESS